MKKNFIGIFLILSSLMILAACQNDDGSEIIQTVPATNNPHLIIDSQRSSFSPGLAVQKIPTDSLEG